ncbi:nitrate regulatory protein [Variovorax terrae]|uniref:Nitrate- and nitrite sensing domain-containing protein n=1 Tax=Variovorax terrae TaxID=2923278 RepID=A0A9X1VSG3_9BURK|nr:nitrate regulatory protein [Variovorax terrae]MCJ0762508.1 nitrate- and nitrite sensing domain-containing protein [Variovorax terrae]
MKSGLSFLVAARQCEIGELEQLALTSELVSVIGRLIHALQRERGMSNVFLGSQGTRFGDPRRQQVAECEQVEQRVREHFDTLDTDASRVRNGARLFSRIAFVLHALDGLPALRQRIGAQALPPEEASAAFVRLIAGLLSVVFEAVDSATDPDISRALVAMFNFMQGKEFAGQERAFGAASFASGHTDLARQQQWRHLIESQERCFEVFADFSERPVLDAWHASQQDGGLAELERLRRIGCAPSTDGALDANLSQAWYEGCTRRIDAMKLLEDQLAVHLRGLCRRKIAQARTELRDQQAILETLSREAGAAGPGTPAHYGPQLERSILGMVQEQAHRLQAMSDELETVRAALDERKLVERAKGLLMARRRLGEDEAYKMLRQTAMNQNRRLVDVARAVLAMADYL